VAARREQFRRRIKARASCALGYFAFVPATEVIANRNGSHTPAIHQIVSTVTSSIGHRIVDAPTRICLRRRGRSHLGSLTHTAHRIRTASREGPAHRRIDGDVREAAKVRRIGVLMGTSESDAGDYFAAFVEELARLGWTDGRNMRIEQRWARGDPNRATAFATELIGLQPDVIFCTNTAVTASLHRETSTIPIPSRVWGEFHGYLPPRGRLR
jgi:hypothetical protein